MPAPDVIKSLVERFEQHRDAYRSGRYNETQLRREFLDPFFEALGWDIFNKQGIAELYKDVIHEDSLLIEGENKAPDYGFRIGGTRKFFVEAKKPAVNIELNIYPAFQLRRYAWSAKLPLSILTDFEEFAVYDCRIKPDKGDKASVGRVMLLSYTDYLEKWDEIAAVFSREAVLKGSFDEYAEGMKTRKGTTEVDDAFLAEIERWRELLARNIALRNPELSVRELNYAVQMTIDRIVFLRICEDRGIERDEQLKDIATPSQLPPNTKSSSSDLRDVPEGRRGSVYSALCQLFQQADARYNSGLFHFKSEKDQSSPIDSLTLSLKIDDKVLQEILRNLYYPESPYVFREIPSDILGQVYERFLGKVIRLTAGHQAKVEEKPEVRKAGGVYYTPTYIVDYIVQNTVGKLLESKTPKEAAKLKILDPACGSGTFPLGAYQYLLDWHLKWYIENDPEKWASGRNPAIFQSTSPKSNIPQSYLGEAGRGYQLTTAKKKEILLNNIFGVDIDAQAVEVTKLSLLLKVLEGENQETIGSQLSFLQERVLPDLGKNIQCGNSLIGFDYFDGQMFVEQNERDRVNAFDWKSAFPQVFSQGGFDVVIGNPPYVHSRSDQFDETEKSYYFRHYKVAEYQLNTFALFIEQGVTMLRPNGLIGMIIPNYWLSTRFDQKLRRFIFFENTVREVLNVYSVFEDATVDTLVLTGERSDKVLFPKKIIIKSVSRNLKSIGQRLNAIHEELWEHSAIYSLEETSNDVAISFSKELNLQANSVLGDFFDMKFGMKPYQVGKGNPPQTQAMVDEKGFDAKEKLGKDYLPLLKARNVKRYKLNWQGDWIKYGLHLAEPRTNSLFSGKRILIQRIVSSRCLDGVYTSEDFVCNTDVITLKAKDNLNGTHFYFFLGLLLSQPVGFYLRSQNVNLDRAAFPKINTKTLNSLPVHSLNFSDPADKRRHDKIVSLVERILELHKRNPRTPQEQEMVKREIESTDRQIDHLVYELYGLTEEEIRIVEGG